MAGRLLEQFLLALTTSCVRQTLFCFSPIALLARVTRKLEQAFL